MYSIPLTILISTILSSTSAVPLDSPSNVSLSSNLPDPRFKIRTEFDTTLLPINAAFLNILYFMGTVAIQAFTEQLPPRGYSAPGYQEVHIESYAWTESRFLLWGIYLAVVHMVEHVRFHNTEIELYWEDKLVGRMRIAAKNMLSLAGNASDDLTSSLDKDEGLKQTISKHSRTPITPHVLPSQTSQKGKITKGNSAANELATLWNATDPSSLAFPTLLLVESSFTALPFSIEFDHIASASPIDRNSVFLTFFTGMLHAAQFHQDEDMRSFRIESPIDRLYLTMYKSSFICQVTTL